MSLRGRLARLSMLFWLLVPLLLWWALREISWQQVAAVLQVLRGWQIAALALLNVLIFLVFVVRWGLILRSLGAAVPFWQLTAFRLAGFGVSYFTPGPQFGGEPLQVYFLQRRQGVPQSAAISSVFLDKLFELLANFTFLAFGLAVTLWSGAGSHNSQGAAWFIGLILLFPAGHLAALRSGRKPLSALLARVPALHGKRVWEVVQQAEDQLVRLIKDRPALLGNLALLSALAWAGMMLEYALALSFLGLPLRWYELAAALTLARLAFLLPLPAGLGALEASQVLAMQTLGHPAAIGLGISLWIRLRDIVLGGFGLWLAGWLARSIRRPDPLVTVREEV